MGPSLLRAVLCAAAVAAVALHLARADLRVGPAPIKPPGLVGDARWRLTPSSLPDAFAMPAVPAALQLALDGGQVKQGGETLALRGWAEEGETSFTAAARLEAGMKAAFDEYVAAVPNGAVLPEWPADAAWRLHRAVDFKRGTALLFGPRIFDLFMGLEKHMDAAGEAVLQAWRLRAGSTADYAYKVSALRTLARALPDARNYCEVGFNGGHSALVWLQERADMAAERQYPGAGATAAATVDAATGTGSRATGTGAAAGDAFAAGAGGDTSHVWSFELGDAPYHRAAHDYVDSAFPGRLSVVYGDSHETVPRFAAAHPEVKCDVIFVDGDHTYRGALEDFRNMRALANSQRHLLVADDVGLARDAATDADGSLGAAYCSQAWYTLVQSGEVVPVATVSPREKLPAGAAAAQSLYADLAVAVYGMPRQESAQAHGTL